MQLQQELKDLERDIISSGGVDENGKYEFLTGLVQSKAASVAHVLDAGLIDEDIARAKKAKEEVDTYIKSLESKKAHLQTALNMYVQENGVLEIETNGIKKYVRPTNSVRHTVDENKLDEDWSIYKVTLSGITENELDAVKGLATLYNLGIKVTSNVGVKDLPVGHKALVEHITPKIKITKTKGD